MNKSTAFKILVLVLAFREENVSHCSSQQVPKAHSANSVGIPITTSCHFT